MKRAVEVLRAGALTTVQDLGRPGLQHIGVPRSGAADREALRLANRLVGNREDSACLESTLIGPRLRVTAACTLALTGAAVEPSLEGRPVAMNAPIHADAGAVLNVGSATAGLRTYIAFRGGIDVEPVLGSRSTDVLSGLGPPALSASQLLPIGTDDREFPDVDQAPVPTVPQAPSLRIIPGPRDDLFTPEAIRELCSHAYAVASNSNRIGVRLEGPPLQRRDDRQLPSEGMVSGAVQVPPSGLPIILLADHPTTGGYPVIAVVVSADLSTVGQLRPGQRIRFRAHPSARKSA